MMQYRGFEIVKTTSYGYTYYRVKGSRKLYTTIKAAKAALDAKGITIERRVIKDANGHVREQVRFLPLAEWDLDDGGWRTVHIGEIEAAIACGATFDSAWQS